MAVPWVACWAGTLVDRSADWMADLKAEKLAVLLAVMKVDATAAIVFFERSKLTS